MVATDSTNSNSKLSHTTRMVAPKCLEDLAVRKAVIVSTVFLATESNVASQRERESSWRFLLAFEIAFFYLFFSTSCSLPLKRQKHQKTGAAPSLISITTPSLDCLVLMTL